MISKFVIQAISAVYYFVKILLPYLVAITAATFCAVIIAAKKNKVKFSQYRMSRRFSFFIALFIAAISVAVAVFYVNKRVDYKIFMYILGFGDLLLGIICAIAFRKSKPFVSISAVLCACVPASLTFGSDNIMNIYYTLFAPIVIGLTMCLYHLFKDGIFATESKSKNLINACIKPIALVLAISLVFISCSVFFLQLFPFTYGPYLNGNGPITELTETVENIPVLKGMKTTEKRAEQFEEFHTVMQSDNLKDKEMAVFGYFPLAFAISDNENYFGYSWIDLGSVSTDTLNRIHESKSSQNIFPVIVLSNIYMNDIGDTVITTADKQEFLDKMLSEHNYEIYYQSENFTVYCP